MDARKKSVENLRAGEQQYNEHSSLYTSSGLLPPIYSVFKHLTSSPHFHRGTIFFSFSRGVPFEWPELGAASCFLISALNHSRHTRRSMNCLLVEHLSSPPPPYLLFPVADSVGGLYIHTFRLSTPAFVPQQAFITFSSPFLAQPTSGTHLPTGASLRCAFCSSKANRHGESDSDPSASIAHAFCLPPSPTLCVYSLIFSTARHKRLRQHVNLFHHIGANTTLAFHRVHSNSFGATR